MHGMGYLEMQSCILPAIKHSGKDPPQLLVSRNMTASEAGRWCRSQRYTIRLKQPWLCQNPGFVNRSWTCQLLVVLISENIMQLFCEPPTCSHSSLSFFILQDSIQFISYPICPFTNTAQLGNVFLFSKRSHLLNTLRNTIWYLSAYRHLYKKWSWIFPTYGHMMRHCQL